MKRLLALLAAVFMIALAVFVRGQIDDEDDNNGGGTSANGSGGTLVCVTELDAVCRELARTEPDVAVRV